MTTGECWRD